MKKIRRILFFFSIVTLWIFIIAKEVVNSKYFSEFISKQVTKFTSDEISSLVNFEKSSIKFFPPGVKIKKVEIKAGNIGNISTSHAFFDEVDLDFNLINLFKNKISFRNVSVLGGYLSLKLRDGGTKGNKVDLGNDKPIKVVNWKKEISGKIQNIIFDGIKVDINRDSFYIKNSQVTFKSNIIFIKSDLHAVSLSNNVGRWLNNPSIIFDKISLDISIDKEVITVNKVNTIIGNNSILYNGEIKGNLSNFDELSYFVDIQVESQDQSLIQNIFFHRKDYFKMDGLLKSRFRVWGKGREYQSNGVINFFNLKTNKIKFDYGEINFKKEKNKLIISQAKFNNKKGEVKIRNPIAIFDLLEKRVLPMKIEGEIKNMALEDTMLIFENSKHKLKSYFSGIFELKLNDGKANFIAENLFFENIQYATKKMKIFNHRRVSVKNVNIIFDPAVKRTLVSANVNLKLNQSSFSISGSLGGEVDIEANFDKLNLEKLIDINGLRFLGEGTGKLNFKLANQSALFAIHLNTEGSEFEGYRFGSLNADMTLSLDRKNLVIERAELTKKNSQYFIDGNIDFKNKTYLKLNGKVLESRYLQLKNLIHPITKNLKFLPENILGKIEGDFKIQGLVRNLNISGRLSSRSLSLWEEEIDSLNAHFLYKNRNLKIENIGLRKGGGSAHGEYFFNGNSKIHYYKVKTKGMRVYDFSYINQNQFGFDADMNILAEGIFKENSIDNKIKINFKNSTITQESVPDSLVDIKIKDGVFNLDASFLDRNIDITSKIFFKRREGESKIEARVKTTKIRELLGAISAHNIYHSDISGNLDMKLKSSFSLNNLKKFDLSVNFNEFNYKNGDIYFEINKDDKNILIKNGEIKSNKITIQGKKTELLATVDYSSGGGFLFLLNGNMNANIIKIFHKNILRLDGSIFLDSSLSLLGDINNTKANFSIKGKDLDISYLGMPALLEGVDIDLTLKDQHLHINNLRGSLGGGKFQLGGYILFKIPFPAFNLSYNFENSEVKIFEKTKIWASSKGLVSGTKPPYTISGDIYITSGEVFDNFKDFKIVKKENDFNYYIPREKNKNKFKFFEIDSRLVVLESIHIKNDLLDMYINGRARIEGSIFSPQIRGGFQLIPDTGKIYFKASNFTLKKGDILFDERGSSRPRINFEGTSKIQNYEVSLKGSGYPGSFNVKLTSSPELSEREIVSLIVTGVIDKSKKHLGGGGESEAAFWGVGMFIFDRFNINQELNSSLGLNLSIDSSVIEDGEAHPKDGSHSIAKRSTKVLVNKKITDNISAEMSSTLGSDISEERSVGINYNINKNLSLESMYEIKGDRQEPGKTSDSIGGDVKLRFEF